LDPRCFANEGGATHAERFGNKRLYFNPANNIRTKRGETMGGWDMIRHRLDGEDGRPMLYFFDCCRDTIRTLPAMQHDPANLEDNDTEAKILRSTWPGALAHVCACPRASHSSAQLHPARRAMGHAATGLHLNRRDAVERASASLLAASWDNEAKGCCQLRPCKRIGITLPTIT
jgi:hypothetical protein